MTQSQKSKPPECSPELWILGGYGDVGLRVAKYIGLFFDNPSVVLVGRNSEKLRSAVQSVSDARYRIADISAADALEGVPQDAVVINCVESFPAGLAAQHVDQGGIFIDMSADPEYIARLRNAITAVPNPKGVALLEAGLAPGLTGILAKYITGRDSKTEQIDVVLELGMGRHHGRAATAWTIESIGNAYRVKIDGSWKSVLPGQLRRKIRFADRSRDVLAIGYGFSDQESIALELQLKSCRTFLALDPPWMTRALAFLAGLSFVRRALPSRAGKVAAALELLPVIGGTGTRLLMEGADAAGQRTIVVEMRSGDQAELTALIIAAAAQAVLTADAKGLTPLSHVLEATLVAQLIAEWVPESQFSGM